MLEIERKYLLSALPDLPSLPMPPPGLEIEQGYFFDEIGRLIRLRRTTRDDGSVRFHQCHKTGQGLIREEVEEEINEAAFTSNWPRTQGKRVVKTRYLISHEGFTWEVDVFADRPLILVEVELNHPDEHPPHPDWLEPLLVREVTEESEFTNYHLAR